MSPLLIGGLIIGGLILLIFIGIVSHGLERARLERARLTAEMRARVRLVDDIEKQLPGKVFTPELQQLLLRIRLHLIEKWLRADRGNADASKQLSFTRDQLNNPQPLSRPDVDITTEAQAKEIRLRLEDLHKLIGQAHTEGVIDKNERQTWTAHIRKALISNALDMFQSLAQQAFQQGKPRMAKLQYERAIAYLQKQNNPAFADLINQFKAKHQHAERLTVEHERSLDTGNTELSAGVNELEAEDEAWKKKAVYDD
ncbi:hypothetical protein [Halopseudomonas salegens]|uniref:Uncharacterized protein n=1 Tax=Halopseudomonas salegens TaxID=1434072 RepID=A0A1H2ES06_9GAMM|nr:hypothetical protein [Halopseudomonas salegens]SDT97855.1 hypothetical protein SAMN05216210_0985 [Halopseudomonas salegens]